MANYYSLRVPIGVLFFFLFIFSNKIKAQTSCTINQGIITVTNTNDFGVGSLREAIACANASAVPETIVFDIPGVGVQTILVGSDTGKPLPTIWDSRTTIDGTTQPGFGGQPMIILDGSFTNTDGPYNGLTIRADFCEIYGLEIRNFVDDGIELNEADNTIIGAFEKGNVIYNNGIPQDVFSGFPGTYEGSGIFMTNNSDFCSIQSNIIGTDYTEAIIGGNERWGIRISGQCVNSQIGGTSFAEGNVIANNLDGILIDNSFNIAINENKIYCNQNSAIDFLNNGNLEKAAPAITTALVGVVAGTAPSGDLIEVFLAESPSCIGTPCQGKTYLGSTISNGGSWVLELTFFTGILIQSGMKITATATSSDGNSSPFASCEALIDISNCSEPDGTIWVTNTNDEGTGSLRNAIHCANNVPGGNTIKFNIPDSTIQHRIYIGSTSGVALPALLDPNTILDATTQPGFGNPNFAPKIILDGSQNNWDVPINAIWVRDNYCEVYGFEIVNFPDDGIDVTAANYAIIGAPNKGNVIYNNGSEVDFFSGLPNTGPWNGCGVVMRLGSSFCTVQGNYIGTNYTQDSTGGNEFCGVIVQSNCQRNLIGGDGVGEENIIAYNEVGVEIRASSAQCRIQQNKMYCNDDGIELVGNANQFSDAPTVDSAFASVVYGKGIPGDFIEVFINDIISCPTANCQGKIFIGETVVTIDSSWALNTPFANNVNSLLDGNLITATATDSLYNTSEFSACISAIVDCDNFVINFENVENAACGLAFGSFEVAPVGGTPPLVFDFGNGPTANSSQENLIPGWYYVTVSEMGGCVAYDSIQIFEGGSPTLTISEVINESCDLQDGFISVSTNGGVAPFLFDIGNGGQPSPTFQNLSAGVYNITLTDALGCQVSISAEVENVPAPFLAVSNLINENCGMMDGGFTVNPFGGTAPILFDIGNGNTPNPTFQGLSSGLYTVTATDNNMCTATVSVVVFDLPPILPFVDNQNNASCSQANGSFEISVFGGIAPYTFDIGNGPTFNNSFSNLAPGNYTITVTDSPGCFTTVNAEVTETDAPIFSIDNIQEEDCGQMNGSFEILATGGAPPYLYDIGSGQTSNSVFSNLNSGTYTVIVTDANGCEVTEVLSLNENNVVLNINNVEDATCGFENGSIMVSTAGGTPPYFYSINGMSSSTTSFSNLAAGVYNIIITDAVGCTDNQSITIQDLSSPTFSVINVQNENCGQTDGSLEVSVTGGTPPYSYSVGGNTSTNPIYTNLNSGFYNIIVTDVNSCTALQLFSLGENNVSLNIDNTSDAICGINNGSIMVSATNGTAPYLFDIGNGNTPNNEFTNLAAGTYNITITDNFGCTDVQTVTLQGFDSPTFSIINMTNENCGQSNGSFELSATGGLPPYQYDIGSGTTSNPVFNNLAAGVYAVTVTDANGCEANQNFTLLENIITLNVNDIQNATCNEANGSITVSATGGTAPFVFDIGNGPTANNVFENLVGGTYLITVTDGDGCSDEQTVGVLSTNIPTFSVINVFNENCGQADGSFEISVTGGMSPYTYDIGTGGQTNPVFENLEAGIYTVVVTDVLGCSNTQEFSLGENNVTLNIDNTSDAICGINNGSITVSANGGTVPYLFDIGNGNTSNNEFTNLAAGIYNITVTDDFGCTDVQTVTLQGFDSPTFSIINISDENCGQEDGSFEISTTGGTPPYQYDIGSGTTTNPVFNNLAAGIYGVTVTDANGCEATQNFTLLENSITLNVDDIQNATCGEANGSITVSATGGVAPIVFDIGNGTTENNVFESLSGGTYVITVTDGNGCSNEQSVGLLSTDAPTFSVINVVDENCGQSDGSFEISATGGMSPYTYDIGTGGQTNPVFENLDAGNYTVVVTDAIGCSNTEVFSLGENTVTLVVNGIEQPTCGEANGSFSVSPDGGTLPYTYNIGNGATSNNIFTNLVGGTYNITITDENGCTDEQTADLQITSAPIISISNILGESCNSMDGTFTVDGMDGEAPYTYDIGNGSTDNNVFTNLSVGSYQVTLTDAIGCTAMQSIDIQAVSAPSLTLGDVFNATCGSANGAISVIGSGGVEPYTYDFGNGATSSNTLMNIGVGTYTVTISDDNNCTGQITVEVLNVGVDPTASFSFSNNLLTANFSNISSNGDSYVWDFGDGNTTNDVNPSHTYSASGNYEVCLTVMNGCGSNSTCQNVSVFQPDDVIFDMSEVAGEVGDTVYVAMSVEHFENIISFQKSIHISDLTVGKFIGVTNLNLPDLDASDFDVSDETITVNWSTGNAGTSVGNGTVIYEIAVELQFKLDCTPLIIDGNPLPLQVNQNINNNNITIGSQLLTGEVCVNGVLGNTVDIAGMIFKENNQMVANVEVTCTNASNPNYTTNSTGVYEFTNLAEGGSYTITPTKNDAPYNGLTVADLFAIQQHILGVNLFDSPYQWIAGDANNSGTITALDMVAIQDIILGVELEFPNNTSWRFVPEDYIFPNLNNPLSPAFPEEIVLNNLTADSLTEHFIAIKIGDVNLTSMPNLTTNNPTDDLVFLLDNQGVTNTDEVVIDVKVKNYNNIYAWQMDFEFDVEGLEFEEITNVQLPNFASHNIGQTFLEKGILPMVWYNPKGKTEGVTLADNAVIFSLKFKVKRDFSLDKNTFGISQNRITTGGFKDGKQVDVKVLLLENKIVEKEVAEMWVQPNRPNPFNQFTEIKFYLPNSDRVKFTIFDQTGRVVENREKIFGAGMHKIRVDETILPELGLYFYQLQTIENRFQGKMIFMK